MDIIRAIEQQQIKEVTPFNVGDTVKVLSLIHISEPTRH